MARVGELNASTEHSIDELKDSPAKGTSATMFEPTRRMTRSMARFIAKCDYDCTRRGTKDDGQIMRVISRSRLRAFWKSHKNGPDAQRVLAAWFKIASNAEWSNFAALKQTFGSADRVGNCVVFDVGNNRYCLIGRVFYPHKFYVLRVMDRQEYSRNAWAKQCGCHNPPPTRSVATMRADRRTKRVPGSRGKRGE